LTQTEKIKRFLFFKTEKRKTNSRLFDTGSLVRVLQPLRQHQENILRGPHIRFVCGNGMDALKIQSYFPSVLGGYAFFLSDGSFTVAWKNPRKIGRANMNERMRELGLSSIPRIIFKNLPPLNMAQASAYGEMREWNPSPPPTPNPYIDNTTFEWPPRDSDHTYHNYNVIRPKALLPTPFNNDINNNNNNNGEKSNISRVTPVQYLGTAAVLKTVPPAQAFNPNASIAPYYYPFPPTFEAQPPPPPPPQAVPDVQQQTEFVALPRDHPQEAVASTSQVRAPIKVSGTKDDTLESLMMQYTCTALYLADILDAIEKKLAAIPLPITKEPLTGEGDISGATTPELFVNEVEEGGNEPAPPGEEPELVVDKQKKKRKYCGCTNQVGFVYFLARRLTIELAVVNSLFVFFNLLSSQLVLTLRSLF
jgi:hypothetical protein